MVECTIARFTDVSFKAKLVGHAWPTEGVGRWSGKAAQSLRPKKTEEETMLAGTAASIKTDLSFPGSVPCSSSR
jgi:hypothetical protein